MDICPQLDMTAPTEKAQWVVINDTVMGGRSEANVSASPDGLVFSGQLSLENNGGFASIRRPVTSFSWRADRAFTLTVVGDGRYYQLRLRTDLLFDGAAYAVVFPTHAGQATSHTFHANDFTAVWRGRVIPNAPPLTFDKVTQLGIMLADKTPGEFSVTLKAIGQC